MGFAKDFAKFAISPAAAIFAKKKKPEVPKVPTMISTAYEPPRSMIGSQRGGY